MPSSSPARTWSRLPRPVRAVVVASCAGAIVLAACSSQPDDGTAPASSADSAPTAPATSPTSTSPPTSPPTTAAGPESTAAPATTTASTTSDAGAPAFAGFAADVLPILEANCASCHIGSGPGTAHLPMDDAALVHDASFEIGAAAAVGYMPPWPAGGASVEFHGDRRLSDAQLELVRQWADAGGPIDVDPATPLVATTVAVAPLERDVVMTGAPYQGSTALRDDYRCQIYDPALTEASFLQGFGLEADRTEVVHHALLFHAEASTRAAAEAADAGDPAIGWECGGLAGFAGSTGDVDQIMSWGPGQDPTRLPADTGIALEPGDFFVTQIHYHYESEWNDLPPDRSAIVLDLASDSVIAAAGGSLDPIELTLYLGPAEIPCSAAETGPLCDRSAAAAELIDTWGPVAGRIADFLMAQCGVTAADFAGMTDGVASSTCDLPATAGEIVSVWGHMHEIGASFRMTLNPDTADERVLLDIPVWDFDWQLDYRPVDTIVLDDDDVIRIECTWLRGLLDEGDEPRYVMWGEGTDDEMCYSQIVTRPPPAG